MSLQTGRTIPVRSKCCKATMTLGGTPINVPQGNTYRYSGYYVCTKCNKRCDIEEGEANVASKGWEERLRDLYLFQSPDKDGMFTGSITFQWGTFEFRPKKNASCEFYLASKSTIEEFISQEIESAKREVLLYMWHKIGLSYSHQWKDGEFNFTTQMLLDYAKENGINLNDKPNE